MSDPSKKANPNDRCTLQSALKRTVGNENESAKERNLKETLRRKKRKKQRTRKYQKKRLTGNNNQTTPEREKQKRPKTLQRRRNARQS